MTRADDVRVVNRVALGALALIAMAAAQHCADAPKAGAQGSPMVRTAARICVLEAMWRTIDCTAILLSASKRSGAELGSEPWMRNLVAYSKGAMRLGKRRVKAAISAEPVRWQALQEFVALVLSGEIPDPCPGAWHFGSIEDGSRGRMTKARCNATTVNVFYALGKR